LVYFFLKLFGRSVEEFQKAQGKANILIVILVDLSLEIYLINLMHLQSGIVSKEMQTPGFAFTDARFKGFIHTNTIIGDIAW
jgi:hypothetical protein